MGLALQLLPLEEWLWAAVPVMRSERMVENMHAGLSWRAVPTPPNGISGGREVVPGHTTRGICKVRMGMGSCVLCIINGVSVDPQQGGL